MIKQLWNCSALMVPVAEFEPRAVCMQSGPKEGVLNPAGTDSVIVKPPGPNVTGLVCPLTRVNEDGVTGLVPVTVTENEVPTQDGKQLLVINKVPGIGGVGVGVGVGVGASDYFMKTRYL
jgi:hypothetical protein